MEKKVKEAYDDLPTYGKVIVTGANKLLKLGGEGGYAKTISFTNPSYANLGSGRTTTTDGANGGEKKEKEPKIFIEGSPSRKPSREEKERASIQQKEVIDRVKRDKDKSYRGQSAIDKKVKQKEEADDPFERTGEKRAKGGLIQRPKRKNKK